MRPSIFTKEVDTFITKNVGVLTYKEISKQIREKFNKEYTEKQVSGRVGNLKLRHHKSKQYDRNFFDKIDSLEKGYWLGFVYADGWITQTKVNAELGIELSLDDINHLHKFKKTIGDKQTEVVITDRPESIIKMTGQKVGSTTTCRLRLYSKDIVNGLISNGVHLNKTYHELSPEFTYDPEINIAIIRGFFDGDGGIDLNGQVKFTAYRKEFLIKLQEYLEAQHNIFGRIFKENRTNEKGEHITHVHRFTIRSSSAENFLRLIYSNMNYSYLDRKYERYKRYYLNNVKE